MTDAELRARLKLLREEGVTEFEGDGLKVKLSPALAAKDPDRPISKAEAGGAKVDPEEDIDRRLGLTPGMRRAPRA